MNQTNGKTPGGGWLWLAVILCSVLWLFAWHVTVAPQLGPAVLLFAAAVTAASLGLRHTPGLEKMSAWYLLLVIPLAAAGAWIPMPLSLGVWVLMAGLIASVAGRQAAGSRAFGMGLTLTGAMLLVQGPMRHLADMIAVRNQFAPPINGLTYLVLKFVGVPVTFDGQMPYIRTMRFLFGAPASWERLALLVLLNVLVGGLIVTVLFRPRGQRLRSVGWMVVAAVGYFVVRYIVVLIVFVNEMYHAGYFDDFSQDLILYRLWIFWSPMITAATMLPLVWVLTRVVRLDPTAKDAGEALASPVGSLPRLVVAVAGVLAVVSAVSFVGYHDPGDRKPGRLMLDETHSGWEKSTRVYDETWYGNESGYNYYCMSQFLAHFFTGSLDNDVGIEINLSHDLTADYLKQFDVLLLKNPTLPYSDEEQKAIVDFVRNGGGVFLMGEHTNVFGTSHPLNQLAKNFGFFFRYNCAFTLNLDHKWEAFYQPNRLLRHPSIQHMDEFFFATSCTIEPTTYQTENVMIGHGLWTLPIQYASQNFYPPVIPRSEMAFGTFAQMVARKYGKGRVIGFSDSTCFSNFSSNDPGKPELLLSSIEWLNRSNVSATKPRLWLFCAILLGAGAVVLAGRTDVRAGTAVVVLALAAGLGGATAERLTRQTARAYPPPKVVRPEQRPLRLVVFDREHSDFAFPFTGFVQPEDRDRAYTVFYQWVLRLSNDKTGTDRIGYYPLMRTTLRESIQTAGTEGMVVILRPRKAFDQDDIDAVIAFLRKGGRLLVLDGPENKITSSNTLLEPLGLSIVPPRQPAPTTLVDSSGQSVCSVTESHAVEGGTPLLWDSRGQAVLSVKKIGKGTVAVMGAAGRFADPQMGSSQSNPPSPTVLPAYALEFRLIKGLLEGRLEEFFPPRQ